MLIGYGKHTFMSVNLNKVWVFRIIHIQNLEFDLKNGLFCKNKAGMRTEYKGIGSGEIIERRSRTPVKCYPGTMVNDYVPFYFSKRTPMLFNIITGKCGLKCDQSDIVYLCCRLNDLCSSNLQWCYTNGNAAIKITKWFKNLDNIENKIDWHSIETTDFRDDNEDGDEDRIRKKHAEFLVLHHVPPEFIKAIVVLNSSVEKNVQKIVTKINSNINIGINPRGKFYF